eukprot:scaffold39247_cov51-Prasinocladus_malaysianus.AAC.1
MPAYFPNIGSSVSFLINIIVIILGKHIIINIFGTTDVYNAVEAATVITVLSVCVVCRAIRLIHQGARPATGGRATWCWCRACLCRASGQQNGSKTAGTPRRSSRRPSRTCPAAPAARWPAK